MDEKKKSDAPPPENIHSNTEIEEPFQPPVYNKFFVLIPLILLILITILWMFFGFIPFLIDGFGIILNKEGLVSVQTKSDGFVSRIFVKVNEQVFPETPLIEIVNPQNNLKFENRKREVQKLTQELTELKKQIQKEEEASKLAYLKQKEAAQKNLKELENSLITLEEELKKKQILYESGLLGVQDLQAIENILSERKIAIQKTKVSLSQIDAFLAKGHRKEELVKKEMALQTQILELELLRVETDAKLVVSPIKGVLLEILTSEGSKVSIGNTLAKIEPAQGEQIFIAYLPAAYGKMIQLNTRVEIQPTNIDSEKYGTIIGFVEEVSEYPVSIENINTLIQNEGIVKYLTQGNKTMTRIIIRAEKDPSSPSGYRWTSSGGPPFEISNGTVFIVKGISGRTSPFYYFFNLN